MVKFPRFSPLLPALGLAALLALPSCKKEELDFDKASGSVWNPQVAVPLLNSRITVSDILDRFNDEDIIVIDPVTGLLALRYYNPNVFSFRADEIVVIPNQNIALPGIPLSPAEAAMLNAGTPVTQGTAITVPFPTPVGGQQLHTIAFKGGSIDLLLVNEIPHNANVTVTLPDLTLSGAPLVINQNVLPGGSASSASPLNGYVLDLTNGSTGYNDLRANVSITYTNAGGVATTTQNMLVTVSLTGVLWSNMTGYLGQLNVSTGIDSTKIRIFDNSTDGIINWADPKLYATFYSSFGMPAQMTISRLDGRPAPFAGSYVPLISSVLPLFTPIAINAPTVMGGIDSTLFSMNVSNSNVVTVMNARPDYLIYDVAGLTNPSGAIINNFVEDSSRIRLKVEAELPFDGSAYDFTRVDSVDISVFQTDSTIDDTSGFISPSNVMSILIRTNIDNGYPAEGFVQAYFVDSTGLRVDSLFDSGAETMIAAAPVDATGNVTEMVRKITDIVIDRETYIRLRDAGVVQLVVFSGVNSTGFDNLPPTRVKIFERYYMDVRVGMMVEVEKNLFE